MPETSNNIQIPGFVRPAAKRSRNMAAIKSKDTKPEILVRRGLHREGFRFRLQRTVAGVRTDIILPKFKIAIFVNGCFWHGHDCKVAHIPKTNAAYWTAKITRNKDRDEENANRLVEFGWRPETIWECRLSSDLKVLLKDLAVSRGIIGERATTNN
ncbi:MAG: hypothetical protein BZY88_08505 [SAR202 cluster bacterium Io17-Chloro-G9]|nr:MAG: hypothetical protein BZY88_08505 [SAR202 cluster bacterium Io17-Chloro-G9]